ncbi:MAG: serine hydrolase [Candidatus Aminicenantes bacterium]|nr:serine hydrolase [Candidatus Aminicenantes bacterium]
MTMRYSSRLRTIYTVVFLILFVSLAYADKKTDAVDKLFAPWDKTITPGCALAVVKDGKIIYKRGYGMANLEHNIPITPQSVFYIGSVSKQFVTMCIALLEKQGKLSIDEDIRKYVPEMPYYGVPIAIRHLIHHTSGLRDYLTLLGIAGIDFGSFHEDDSLELIVRQRELNFKPGEQYLYSNSGYFLLAVIVERASGKSLREYAEENIFKPLGMQNSHFHDDYTMLIKNRASGHYLRGKGKYINFISTFDCVGSGGLFTSVEDLFLWDQNFYHYKVGGKEVHELLHTRGTLNNGTKLDYAFALGIGTYKGLETVSHGGALGGYRSNLIRFPEQNFSVICLSNLSTFNPGRLSQQVADIYLSGHFKKEAKEEIRPKEKVKFIRLPEKKLKEKVGAYVQPETGKIVRLFFRGRRLNTRLSGRNYPLEALSDTEFILLNAQVKTVVKFEKQKKGKPLLLHIYTEGKKPEIYEAAESWEPTPDQLQEFTGDYYSEELQATFSLALRRGKLHFTHRNAPEPPLQPTLQDKFTVRSLRVNFVRIEDKKISGFILDAGRVRNLRFDKKTN